MAQFVSEDHRITHYRTFGEDNGKPILLLHGLGGELSLWRMQTQVLVDYGYFVIAMDMYGHGESSPLLTAELSEWNSQILGLMDHLKISKFALCGVSMGGVIAQSFTVNHHNRVKALIVSDSFCELKSAAQKMLGVSQLIGFRIFQLLGRKTFAKGMASAYKYNFAEQAREYMYKQSLNADFDQLITARKAINKVDLSEKLKNIKIPSLVVVGKCFGKLFIDINKTIASSIPDSRLVLLDDSMDPSPLVNPESFNKAMLSFLKEH